MDTLHDLLVSQHLPGIGVVLASICTRYNQSTDRLESEVLYKAQQGISGGVHLSADRWVMEPVNIDESFMHQEAASWVKLQLVHRLNELAIEHRDFSYSTITPGMTVIADIELAKLWLLGVATNGLRYLEAATHIGKVRSKIQRFTRMPQIEALPLNPTGPGQG